jgi:hypothetical protein
MRGWGVYLAELAWSIEDIPMIHDEDGFQFCKNSKINQRISHFL